MRQPLNKFTLRCFEEKDCVLTTEYLNDEDIALRLVAPPFPFKYEHALDFFHTMSAAEKAGRPEAFVLANKKTDALMGVVGLHPQPPEKPPETLCKIGYWLGKPHWGHGYLQEALRFLLPYAFSTLRYDRIVGYTNTDNERSQNALRKAGFSYLGLIPSRETDPRVTPQSTSWELLPSREEAS